MTLHEERQAGRTEKSDDGELFVNVSDRVVNHVLDQRAPRSAFRPHLMIFFITMDFENPLSAWLRGADQEPSNPWPKSHRALCWEGEGQWQGLRTVRVREERGPDAATAYQYHLEFVPERSWLPVRMTGRFHLNKNLVVSHTEVEEMGELSPGLWVPTLIKSTMSDIASLRKGIQQTDRYGESRVTSLKANPSYPKEFFTNYRLPEDAIIYEVKGGRIIRTIHMEAGKVVSVERPWLRAWLPWAGGVAGGLILLLAVWLVRRRWRLHAA
ncbi:MAG TPA: hypothetical protein PKD86_05890 [Gemmatales bacterium]|nr:hypothetical protein [Gemmatales bacterium]HMP58865.1 hypothetical protein [Gemmatales bacterium]